MNEDIESIENASTANKSVLDYPSNKNSSKDNSHKKNLCHKDFATTTNEKVYVKPMLNNRNEFPIIPTTDPTIHQSDWENFVDNVLTVEHDSIDSYIRIKWVTGHITKHPSIEVNCKCHMKILQFYESNINFVPTE